MTGRVDNTDTRMTTQRRHPLYLIFQWHMHQPFYKDELSGEYLLPWTRLHVTKDYTDMAWHLERHPEVRSVVNFVPSLLLQIREYEDLSTIREKHLQLTLKPAEELSQEEKDFLLQEFFSANYSRIIERSPRYKALYQKRPDSGTSGGSVTAREKFSSQDYRDLQVWFLLAWTGQEIASEPEVRSMVKQDRGFSKVQKERLLEIHQKYISDVIDRYHQLWKSGQIELSVSPYAHPILPLLMDSEVARICMPGLQLPRYRFRHPGEARRQVDEGLNTVRQQFGWEVQGMWPSEGSVSEEVVNLLAAESLRWITTDSNVLARSLSRNGSPAPMNRGEQYSPYTFETPNGPMNIFFRDQMLSDLIGFQYAKMDSGDAVSDFIGHLRQIHTGLPDDEFPYVAVITMDGENAWEHFEANGKPFFDKLYTELTGADWLETTTFSEYLDQFEPQHTLEWLHPGSWINADYHIWIGHPEKNAAWDVLNDAVQLVRRYEDAGEEIPGTVKQALLQAEGSDWFWWYGDHNNSDHDEVFDLLFCDALRAVYRGLGEEPPAFLQRHQTLASSLK